MNCNSSQLHKFIDLGTQPNGNHFLEKSELDNEQLYPFAMLVCKDCWQVQLEEFPAVSEMFSDHPYVTGLNKPVVEHFQLMAQDIINKYKIPKHSLVLDIGANDGSLLKEFKQKGMQVLGIDPSNRTHQIAKENEITIAKSFWNKVSATSMTQLGLYPDLITATAVFYHTDDLHSFIEGLALVMKKNTVFCTQCIYLKDVIELVQFDHFYHEHTLIHSIKPLQRIFRAYDLRLLDIDFYSIHGGSFLLYVGREESDHPTSPKIEEVLIVEEKARLNELETYLQFTERVKTIKQKLGSLLTRLKKDGKKIYGLGAALKGNTLLNYCGIGPDLIDCIVEVNPYKVGKYSPGMHIPIVDEKNIDEHPDYYLILSWNYVDYFKQSYKDYLQAGGQFILPHPEIEILGAENSSQGLDLSSPMPIK